MLNDGCRNNDVARLQRRVYSTADAEVDNRVRFIKKNDRLRTHRGVDLTLVADSADNFIFLIFARIYIRAADLFLFGFIKNIYNSFDFRTHCAYNCDSHFCFPHKCFCYYTINIYKLQARKYDI